MTANEQQREHWNGSESEHWVTHADRYDRQLEPFVGPLLDRLGIRPGDRVVDIGCGCGATTLEAAQRGAERVVGIDISAPMLAVARERARAAGVATVEFVVADAQTHRFEASSVDVVASRFGVMFFDDPLAAFTNLHGALAAAGRLGFVCWQPLAANPWLLVPGLAAAAHVPLPELGGDGGPGMFSLASPDTIRAILQGSGFARVDVEALTPTLTLGGAESLGDAVDYLLGTGIARAILDPAPPDARQRAIEAVTAVLAEHHEPGLGVRLGSGAWLVTATR